LACRILNAVTNISPSSSQLSTVLDMEVGTSLSGSNQKNNSEPTSSFDYVIKQHHHVTTISNTQTKSMNNLTIRPNLGFKLQQVVKISSKQKKLRSKSLLRLNVEKNSSCNKTTLVKYNNNNMAQYCQVILFVLTLSCALGTFGPNRVSAKLSANNAAESPASASSAPLVKALGESAVAGSSPSASSSSSSSATILSTPTNISLSDGHNFKNVQKNSDEMGSVGGSEKPEQPPSTGHHHRLHHRLRHHHKGKKFRQHQQNTINYLMSVILDSSASKHKASAHTGIETAIATNSRQRFFLTSMLSRIMNVMNVTEFAFEVRDGISSRASCVFCNAVAGLFLSPLYSKDVFSAAIKAVCTSFRLFTPRVCSGFVESFQDDFEYIRKNTRLTRDEVCAVIFGTDCARRLTHNLNWTIPIPSLPRNVQSDKLDEQPAASNQQSSNGVKPASHQGQDQSATPRPNPLGIILDEVEPPDLLEYRKSGASSSSSVTSSTSGGSSSDQSLASGRSMHQSSDGGILPDNGSDKISNFVQITDVHVDPYYEPGTSADCREPLCCRLTSGLPSEGRRAAGSWGDYGNCDTPITTLRHAFNRIRHHHQDSEYWIWTGDIAPHDIWNVTRSEVIHQIRLISGMMKEYSSGPVFPVVGNHESVPVNSFAPPEIRGKFSMSWLYDVLADEWGYWLPEDAKATLKIGGYYRVKVRHGFRIICINTNYCARLNPWSLYNPVDPGNQLKWLSQQLQEAEQSNDKVHIIGHIPPDNRECTQAWLFNFIRLVDRFKDTILGQFYGHTHRDEFRVIYSLRSEAPVGVAYIGPSVTPFTENNSAYRVYHQDQSGHLVDAQTYYFNLTEANNNDDGPVWRHEYRVSSHLNMTSMRPKDWHLYIQKMHEDETLFDQFHRHFYRSSDVKRDTVCRAKCKYHMLNDLRVAHPFKTRPKPLLANRKNSNHNHHG
ncbi:Sphingomyelin phosphodiesterase, partial [Fragariocoptes setiger]